MYQSLTLLEVDHFIYGSSSAVLSGARAPSFAPPNVLEPTKKLFISAAITFSVLTGALTLASALALGYDDIYPGVVINGVDLSGMNAVEAKAALRSANTNYSSMTISFLEKNTKIDLNSLLLKNDDRELEAALGIGHEGGPMVRLRDIVSAYLTHADRGVPPQPDRDAIYAAAADFDKRFACEPVPNKTEFENGVLTVKVGRPGISMDTKLFADELTRFILRKGVYLNNTVFQPESVTYIMPDAIDLKKLASKYYIPAVDATSNQQGENMAYTAEEPGMQLDDRALATVDFNNFGAEYKIPLVSTTPVVTMAALSNGLYSDLLASVSTFLDPDRVDRTTNVRLACEGINNVVIAPGEEFSFNKILGPRTYQKGYKDATVFEGGRVTTGIAGGICQVSTTLHMAAVQAGMEITERRNHTFLVEYAPPGQDAAVSYGSGDFRFKNISESPILVSCVQKNNRVSVNIFGTKKADQTYEFETEVLSLKPFEISRLSDASLAPGTHRIISKGVPAVSSKTYVVTYDKNGEEISRKFLNSSTYRQLDQVERVAPDYVPDPNERRDIIFGVIGS